MRRIAIWVSDDILMEELIAMATAAGFYLRHRENMTTMDRVPGIIRRDAPENVRELRKAKK